MIEFGNPPSDNSEPFQRRSRRSFFPMFQGLLPIDARRVARDILAGVTLAALAIPEVMGYARIAGTPVVAGLYTLLLPAALFALFGASRLLVVGADSATAAIMAGFLARQFEPASPEWMAAAGMLALLTALILMVVRFARLAFLADFLSRTVLIGFLSGVGVRVALGEVPGLLGLHAVPGHGGLQTLWTVLSNLRDVRGADAAIGLGVVALTALLRAWSRRVPGALIAVAGALALSWAFDLPAHGVAVLGSLQGGLPRFSLPGNASAWSSQVGMLIPTAVAMSVVILAQSVATARAYGWKYDEPSNEDADLLGLALANVGAGVTGAFVVNGSPTKTQMVDAAGGRSQFAHLTMAAIVLLVLLFLGAPIAFLPTAALAGVVFLIGVELVDVRHLRAIRAARSSEFWVAVVTAAMVVLAGVEQAIALAMALSLIDHVRRGYRPRNQVIVRGEDGHARLLPVGTSQYAPGLLVYRFSHSMYYANADLLSSEVAALASGTKPPLRWFVIDMDAVDDVDYSAGATLLSLRKQLAEKHIELKFLRATQAVSESLRAYGLLTAEDGKTFASIRQMRHRFENIEADSPAK